MVSLKLVQNVHGLPLEMRPKPVGQLFDRTDPFTGIDRITDSVNAPIGCPEVCIVTKNRKIKETGIFSSFLKVFLLPKLSSLSLAYFLHKKSTRQMDAVL